MAAIGGKKKKVKQRKMKPLEHDPCPKCLYGKERLQHKVPTRVEEYRKVKPAEAFGPSVKKSVQKKKTKKV
tara:strand:- start:121 stop:333 length:213 start_codon:yes stop_codon:yes gene_type:complete